MTIYSYTMSFAKTNYKKWLPAEEKQLLFELANNISFEEIGRIHGRTARAIECRAKELAVRLVESGVDTETAAAQTRISEVEIADGVHEREAKKAMSPAGLAEQLTNINEKLDRILMILDQ